jgi:uncharacterized protein (DUF305 family)
MEEHPARRHVVKRSVAVAVGAALVVVLVTAGLAVAWWDHDGDHDGDDRGPGMMSTTSQDRGTSGFRGGGAMYGSGQGMHGWTAGGVRGRMAGGMPGGMYGGMGGMHVVVRSEYGYLVKMIAHHEEAIAAARELARSDRPQMRRLGRSIVAGQGAQVVRMQAWLAEWYPDRPTTTDYRPMMRDLQGLSGDRLDRVFLEDMIGHHMAAVMMSQQLLARDLADHAEVAALARSISVSQRREIMTMRRWLWQWFR